MDIRCCSFSDMADEIKKNGQRIVLFGSGVIGTVTAPEILSDNGLLPYVDCYIDNDSKKWGTYIETAGKKTEVLPPRYLEECGGNTVILLNISRYAEVLKQLEHIQNMTCYIMPVMCIYNYCNDEPRKVIREAETPLIPRIIHYMWLGEKEMPRNLQKCIDSWKRFCPDYEIIRWDETNYDMDKSLYMKQAYEHGAYGFVPDYARLDILYHYGGIYMDTDVELIRPLDALLYQEAFCGVEKWQTINLGGCSGAVKGHRAIRSLLENREDILYIGRNGESNRNTCGFYDTKAMLDNGYKINGRNQNILGMNIYTYDYFHPYDYMSGQLQITGNTFSIHHFNGGWLDEKMEQANRKTVEEFRRMYKNMILENKENINE